MTTPTAAAHARPRSPRWRPEWRHHPAALEVAATRRGGPGR